MQLPSVVDILASAPQIPGALNASWDVFSSTFEKHASDDWASPPTTSAGSKRDVSRPHQAGSVMARDSFSEIDMTPTQTSVTKGYSDGFLTAGIFASYCGSRLGFIEQYIQDSIGALGPTGVGLGTEGLYQQWFMSGLQDGEARVMAALKST